MRYWKIGVLLVGAISSLSLGQSAPTSSLQDQAKQVARGDKDGYNPCLWLSDQEAVISVYHPHQDYLEMQRLNIQRGTHSPLTTLNIKCRKSLEQCLHDYAVSPDGKWLFWCMDVKKRDAPKATIYVATTLDGAQQRQWKTLPDEGEPRWFPDHRRWFTITETPMGELTLEGITVRDLQHPGITRRVSLKETNPEQAALGVTNQERLLLAGLRVPPTSIVQMADYSLNAVPVSPHRFAIHLPRKAKIQTMKLSPQGDRLAWLLLEDNTTVSPKSAQSASPPIKPPHWSHYSLWISGVDGAHMTQIGRMATLPEAQANQNMDYLQWLPSGKKLSFVYKQALYTVAVP